MAHSLELPCLSPLEPCIAVCLKIKKKSHLNCQKILTNFKRTQVECQRRRTSESSSVRVDSCETLGGSEVRDLQDTTVGVHKHIVPLDVSVHYLTVVLNGKRNSFKASQHSSGHVCRQLDQLWVDERNWTISKYFRHNMKTSQKLTGELTKYLSPLRICLV